MQDYGRQQHNIARKITTTGRTRDLLIASIQCQLDVKQKVGISFINQNKTTQTQFSNSAPRVCVKSGIRPRVQFE